MYGTMLIVEDLEINRVILAELFQDTFTVLEAENGEQALEILDECKNRIDIVLLDLYMPGISGFDILDIRRSLDYFSSIPVVVITSSNATHDQVEAFNKGANDYICKPFIPEIVTYRVNNVLTSTRRYMAILKERESLQIKAELDMMTGLYNKTTAERMINECLMDCKGKLHALMVFDIDNFKMVNDTEGHLVGDHTIKIIADLISSHYRKTDILGRIGGDEFVALVTDIPSREIVRKNAMNIVRLLKYKPNLTIPANVSISVGIAFNESENTDYETLFSKADEALYRAKRSGKGQYMEYGLEKKHHTVEKRKAVILCSTDKRVCNVFAAAMPPEIMLVEAGSAQMLLQELRERKGKVKVVFIDVSEEKDKGRQIWNLIQENKEEIMPPVLAICKEGVMEQYKLALSAEVKDIISKPIDDEGLRRRLMSFQ